MNRLIEETTLPDARELDDALGLEGEVLGVDPVTSLLDDIVERYESSPRSLDPATVPASGYSTAEGEHGEGTGDTSHPGTINPLSRNTSGGSWLLDDGPVHPENLERGGTLPPLIFSNSYKDLPALGHRFIRAGASTFVGPIVPLFSRPARTFAGHFYGAMGRGWCAGAALWQAAQNCRHDLGAEHPAWLSYGVQGTGQIALQYL